MNPLLLKYGAGAIGIICMALAVWWAWGHYIAEPYREQGRIEVRKELQPKIDNLTVDNKSLQDDFDSCGTQVNKQNAQIEEQKKLTEQQRQQRVTAEKKAKDIANHRNSIINAAEDRETPSTCDAAVLEAQKELQ